MALYSTRFALLLLCWAPMVATWAVSSHAAGLVRLTPQLEVPLRPVGEQPWVVRVRPRVPIRPDLALARSLMAVHFGGDYAGCVAGLQRLLDARAEVTVQPSRLDGAGLSRYYLILPTPQQNCLTFRADDPRLQVLAQLILLSADGRPDAVRQWVRANIRGAPSDGSLNPGEIIAAGRGECLAKSCLLATLLQAVGVQARVTLLVFSPVLTQGHAAVTTGDGAILDATVSCVYADLGSYLGGAEFRAKLAAAARKEGATVPTGVWIYDWRRPGEIPDNIRRLLGRNAETSSEGFGVYWRESLMFADSVDLRTGERAPWLAHELLRGR